MAYIGGVGSGKQLNRGMEMELSNAKELRQQYLKTREILNAEGIDTSGIRFFADLKPALLEVMPEELKEQAAEFMEEDGAMEKLTGAFIGCAVGCLTDALL